MTTPPASFPQPPDQAGWTSPTTPAPPTAYAPLTPPGGMAPPATVTPPPFTADGRRTSMWLPLEGAAGSQIAIYKLDKNHPVLVIDGVRAKRDLNGYFKIPMANGKSEKLRVRAMVPGYPTLKFRGKVLYKSPKPPAMLVVGYLVPALGGGLMVAVWFGGIVGAVAAFFAGYGAAAWLRNAPDKRVPYLVLIGGGVIAAVLGVMGIIFTFQVRS